MARMGVRAASFWVCWGAHREGYTGVLMAHVGGSGKCKAWDADGIISCLGLQSRGAPTSL